MASTNTLSTEEAVVMEQYTFHTFHTFHTFMKAALSDANAACPLVQWAESSEYMSEGPTIERACTLLHMSTIQPLNLKGVAHLSEIETEQSTMWYMIVS
eukprot:5551108-Amphidinium_carterae.1